MRGELEDLEEEGERRGKRFCPGENREELLSDLDLQIKSFSHF